ncbi:MAG: hypothetical protein JO266_08835 [Acidobacteria bacterium]|nr:hypothetical protein [Acidobacteriota bacterium]
MMGVAGAAVATIIVSVLTGIPVQLFDTVKIKDTLRTGPDLSATADIIYMDDQGNSMVLPGDFQPDPQLRRMMAQSNGAKSPQVISRLREAGGADVENLTVRVILQGRRNQQIRILNVRPILLTRTDPLNGTLFFSPPQEGDATLRMMFNLDEPTPIAHESIQKDEKGNGIPLKPGPPFFENTTISLNDNEQQVLVIRAEAKQHYVVFDLAIDYRIGDSDKTIVVSYNGHPFRITGMHYGPTRDTYSYQRAFGMTGDYSYCAAIEPRAIPIMSGEWCTHE